MQHIGKYQIKQLVARGGMGELYLARDPDLDRDVAVKVMSDEIMRDEQARARFYREAKAAARLQHRNIVTVFDFAHDGEVPYIVMEFLRGQNLAQRLPQSPALSLVAKLELGTQLCEGLHFAHGQGVVHRDVKPANIWLLPDGGVKLLDFGIAKSATGTFTHRGTVVGSAAYMSPEQIEGQPVDARSDVFSTGAVLFELIAGQRAFDGRSVTAVMMKITQEEPAPDVRAVAPETPAAVASIIARALQKAPADRYPGAAEMAVDLRLARLEITNREEDARTTMSTRRVPARPYARPKAQPNESSTLQSVAPRTAASPAPSKPSETTAATTLEPLHDYVLRRPEELQRAPLSERSMPVHRRKAHRWPLVIGGVVAISALAAFVLVAGPFPPTPIRMHVTSSPEHARIFLDGADTGLHTPAELQFARLPMDVRLELTGYEAFVTSVTEQHVAKGSDRRLSATLVRLPDKEPSPQPPPPPPPPPPKPEPLQTSARLKLLQSPGKYESCRATIGRWKGEPFTGVGYIEVPARSSYKMRIECPDQEPVEATIQVPPGTNDRNFNDVVTLTQE